MKINAWKYRWTLPQEITGYWYSRIWRKQLSAIRPSEIDEIKAIEKEFGIKLYICPYDKHKAHPILKNLSASSIGRWVCLNDWHDIWVIRHEAGHKVDSDKLGWFYLPIIGIASSACNLWDRWFHKKWPEIKSLKWYYNRWQEKRADHNAGFYREFENGEMVCLPLKNVETT